MAEFKEKYIEIDGFAGSYGAARIFEQNEAEYRRYFREEYVQHSICDLSVTPMLHSICDSLHGSRTSDLSVTPCNRSGHDNIVQGVTLRSEIECYTFCEDGIIAEINRVCGEEKVGYELELRKIPIKQFTIEICERAKVNPYELPCYARVRLVDEKTPASCGRTTQALRKTLLR